MARRRFDDDGGPYAEIVVRSEKFARKVDDDVEWRVIESVKSSRQPREQSAKAQVSDHVLNHFRTMYYSQ